MIDYSLFLDSLFVKNAKKLFKKNKNIEIATSKALSLLKQNPYHPSLKTHKVESKSGKKVRSSWVTGDIRILWDFHNQKIRVLEVFDIGGHSGSRKIYK